MKPISISKEYPYQIKTFPLMFGIVFFSGTALILGYKLQQEWQSYVLFLCLLSFLFVLAAGIVLVITWLRPQSIVHTKEGLWIPLSPRSADKVYIAFSDILHTRLLDLSHTQLLSLAHKKGLHHISSDFLSSEDFAAIAKTIQVTLPPIEPSFIFRISPHLRILLYKLSALWAFCGAPLYLLDRIEGQKIAFVVFFAPIAIMMSAFFSLFERSPSVWNARMIQAGTVSCILLFAQLLISGCMIILLPHTLHGFYLFGFVGTLIFCGFYLRILHLSRLKY